MTQFIYKKNNRKANHSIDRIKKIFTKILIYSYYIYKNILSCSRLNFYAMVMPNEKEQVRISNN